MLPIILTDKAKKDIQEQIALLLFSYFTAVSTLKNEKCKIKLII